MANHVHLIVTPTALDEDHYWTAMTYVEQNPVRARIVPTSRAVGLTEILAAADEYYQASGRRLTFEYVLLAGINDGRGHAEQLAELLAPRRALVNVIPYNPVPGLPYRAPSSQVQSQFRAVLESKPESAEAHFNLGAARDVTITFQARTNSIVAVAPPMLLNEIEKIVREMDDTTTVNLAKTRRFELKETDAETAANLLQALLEGRSGTVDNTRGAAGSQQQALQAVMLLYEDRKRVV